MKTGRLGALAIGLLAVPRHRHQPKSTETGLLYQTAGKLVPIHDGKADVEQSNLRLERGRYAERGGAVVRHGGRVTELVQERTVEARV